MNNKKHYPICKHCKGVIIHKEDTFEYNGNHYHYLCWLQSKEVTKKYGQEDG